jgi:hypothetical protein
MPVKFRSFRVEIRRKTVLNCHGVPFSPQADNQAKVNSATDETRNEHDGRTTEIDQP